MIWKTGLGCCWGSWRWRWTAGTRDEVLMGIIELLASEQGLGVKPSFDKLRTS